MFYLFFVFAATRWPSINANSVLWKRHTSYPCYVIAKLHWSYFLVVISCINMPALIWIKFYWNTQNTMSHMSHWQIKILSRYVQLSLAAVGGKISASPGFFDILLHILTIIHFCECVSYSWSWIWDNMLWKICRIEADCMDLIKIIFVRFVWVSILALFQAI